MCGSVATFLYFNLKGCKRLPRVVPGKINHKNAIKSCQIVLFSSKTATERASYDTVVCFDLPIFTKHSLDKWTKKT